MDARRILGVSPSASRGEVRAAYGRLAAQVRPDAGGSAGLADVVAAAYRHAMNGEVQSRPPAVDPYAVLGVTPSTSRDEVRTAFRRLARLVHPDRGGTDELFRILNAAYDLIVNPFARLRDGRSRYRPPPPPPPPGPFRPAPPETRRHEARWRSWVQIVANGMVLLAAAAVVLGAVAISLVARVTRQALPLIVVATIAGLYLLRPAIIGLRRAVVRLRSRRARENNAAVDGFLSERCLDAPVGREREDVLYRAYTQWCYQGRHQPISQWAFLEYLRSLGVLYVNASSWDQGVLVGIRLREERAAPARDQA